jgi:hypothetical protein
MDMVTHLLGSLECPWTPEAHMLGGGAFMDAATITALEDKILAFLRHYAAANKFKIQAAGIGIGNYHKTSYVTWGGRVHATANHAPCGQVGLARRLWLDLDIIPCHVTHSGDAKLGNVQRIEEMADFDGGRALLAVRVAGLRPRRTCSAMRTCSLCTMHTCHTHLDTPQPGRGCACLPRGSAPSSRSWSRTRRRTRW